MITGRILLENGRFNIECYAAGTNGGLPLGAIACAPNGVFRGLYWALPCTSNGQTLTGFELQMATNGTKPRADAVKVLVVEDTANGGGSYKGAIVVDAFTLSDYVEACCAGCDALADVTVVEPILLVEAECYVPAPTPDECTFRGSMYVQGFTGSNNTYTATAYGYNADGDAITFAPTTATGTSVTLLAADMQSKWASELGTGTFTATGNVIYFTSTNGAKVYFSIAQSEV